MGIILKTWKLILSLGVVSGVIHSLHSGLERHRYTRQQQEFSFLPSADHVRMLSMGHTETAASLLWVRGIIYFGESLMTRQKIVWMEHLIDLVTMADPKFSMAYHFLGTAIQAEDFSDNGFIILKRGVQEFPNDWKLSLYYSMLLIKIKNNYLEASVVMDKFKNSQDVPKYIQGIGTSLKRRQMPVREALHLYLSEYFNQPNPVFKKNIKNRILSFLSKEKNYSDSPFRLIFKQFEQKAISPQDFFELLVLKYHQKSK